MIAVLRCLRVLVGGVALSSLLASAPACAETYYKWVDQDGITHYSKEKPTDRESEETLVVRSEGQAPPIAPVSEPEAVQPLPDGSMPAPTKAQLDYAAARQKAAACAWATGGLKIAERFFQASLRVEEQEGVQDTAKYRQEADEMRQVMSQNCEPAAPAS